MFSCIHIQDFEAFYTDAITKTSGLFGLWHVQNDATFYSGGLRQATCAPGGVPARAFQILIFF